MASHALESTVSALLVLGKGILAADESLSTIGERFKALDISSTEESRRAYREMLFTTPGIGKFISGVILHDETIHQQIGDVSIPEALARQGIVPGIKVDAGTTALPGFAGEKITQGLDGLGKRLAAYRELGARFTKWRAVIAISEHLPTAACVEANARTLALFAAFSQEIGLVPIIEPEVLMNGSHSIGRCEEVTTFTLERVFDALFEHRVVLEHLLLKTGMVLSGAACPEQAGLEVVGEATRRCLRRTVPAAVPGIVFLSGGQSEVAATQRLNAICRGGEAPWRLTFSFARALQSSAMEIWQGSPDKVAAAQQVFYHRAQCNSAATEGKYSAELEKETVLQFE
jgi:fructose-bisphosphate aldolase class I